MCGLLHRGDLHDSSCLPCLAWASRDLACFHLPTFQPIPYLLLASPVLSTQSYAPKVFHHLRKRFGIANQQYAACVGGMYDYIEFNSNAKSGSFFFFSHDGRFMIKTMTKEESKFLRRILPHYYVHAQQNPETFLCRFYGMHRVDMPHLKKSVYFLVMHSVTDSGDTVMTKTFDLKGSSVGRAATAKEKKKYGDKVVYKDNDLLKMGVKVRLGANRRNKLLQQLRVDVDFLARMGIMDYSILLGIQDPDKEYRPVDKSSGRGGGAGLDRSGGSRVPSGSGLDEVVEPEHGARWGAAAPAAGGRAGRAGDSRPAPGLGRGSGSFARKASSRLVGRRHSATPRAHVHGQSRKSRLSGSGRRSLASSGSATRPTSVGGGGGAASAGGMHPSASVDETMSDSNVSLASGSSDLPERPEFTPADANAPPRSNCPIPSYDPSTKELGKEIYYMGVIDILQAYNMRKHAETALFSVTKWNRYGISCVPPGEYANRFMQYVEDMVV